MGDEKIKTMQRERVGLKNGKEQTAFHSSPKAKYWKGKTENVVVKAQMFVSKEKERNEFPGIVEKEEGVALEVWKNKKVGLADEESFEVEKEIVEAATKELVAE